MRRLLLIAAAALVLVPAASARVSLGLLGNPGRLASQTGQRSTVGHVILGWNQGNTWGARLPVQFASHGPVPMVGFTTSRGWPNPFETITPRGVALGQGDGYLAALNHAIAGWGRMIYVRPLPEMNGYWNAYCAYTQSGRRKASRTRLPASEKPSPVSTCSCTAGLRSNSARAYGASVCPA